MEMQLHPSVEIIRQRTGQLEMRDRRTGLHVSLEGPTFEFAEALSREARDALKPLGFLDDLPLHELRARQRPFRNELQAQIRNGALRELGSFVSEHVPYYRRNSAYDWNNVRCTNDLITLPILRKPDIRAHFSDLLADTVNLGAGLADDSLRIARTSGTTDERLQVVSDMHLDRVPPDYEGVWNLDHGDRIPKTAILTSPLCTATECHLGKSSLHERVRYGSVLHLNSTEDLFSVPESLVRNVVDELWEFGPEFLLVNPVYLHWLGLEAQRLGLALPPFEVILSSYQFLSRLQKRGIERIFKAPVYNSYAATELAGCCFAIECKHGHWHVREDHVILEILNNAVPTPFGEIGSVIATATANRVMPLVRYDVGDLARLIDVDCECALSDWQCLEFHGRKKDTLQLGGQVVTTKQIDDVVSEVEGIEFYRCRQRGPAKLYFDLIPSAGCAAPADDLAERIRDAFPASQVHVSSCSRLDPEPSMKFRLTAMEAD